PDLVVMWLRKPNRGERGTFRGEGVGKEKPIEERGNDHGARPEEAHPRVAGEHRGEGARTDERHGAASEDHRGTGTVARIDSSKDSTFTPSNWASARSCTRWRRVGWARALTSSGVTYIRPLSQAHAREVASRAVAPRGETPSCSEGEVRVACTISTMYPSTSGEVCTSSTSACACFRSSGVATARRPASARLRGSKFCAWRVRISISASRSGSGTRSFNKNLSSWASGSMYVPSYSTGFWVAMTMKGSGRGMER